MLKSDARPWANLDHALWPADAGRERDLSNPRPSVTLLCARFWPDRHGGVEQRMWHVSRTMARQGIGVEVLTENRTQALESEQIELNLTVRRLDPMQPGWAWRWREIPRLMWWSRAIQCWVKQGLIWATDPIMAVATILAGRREDLVFNPAGCVAGMRHISQIHPDVVTMRRPRRLMWLDRVAYRHAPRVILSSHNLERQYERFYGRASGAVHVVPHGTQSPMTTPSRGGARRRWDIGHDAFVVGFLGRMDPCKAVDHLLRSVSNGDLKHNDRLLLVGDGSDCPRLEAVANQLGLAEKIIWTGALTDPAEAYAAMDVLVLPSVYEAFGLVLLEAMAHGIPVIARRGDDQTVFTAADEIIQDGFTGVIADSTDIVDLSAIIRMLQADRPWRQAMGQRARQAAFARSWDRVVDDYRELLDLPNVPATNRAQAA